MGRQYTWYSPADEDGLALSNLAGGSRVLAGAEGLGKPDAEITYVTTPLLNGAQVVDVYAPPRTIKLPMQLEGADRDELTDRIRALCDAMDPDVPGQLEVAHADGRRRRIWGRYKSGLEGAEDAMSSGDTFYRFVLTLLCVDPFFFDPEPVPVRFEYVAAGIETLPMPDAGGHYWNLVPSTVLGSATVTNPGNVLSWMTWTVTPPASTITIANNDTGEQFAFATALPAGKPLTVVTEPPQPSIKLSDGTRWWNKLVKTPPPALFPIRPGDNQLTLTVTGSAAGTSISGLFTPRYKDAW